MKIELSTTKGEIAIELFTAIDRLKFSESLPRLVAAEDFKYASIIEDEGTAKFTTIEGLLKALKNYED